MLELSQITLSPKQLDTHPEAEEHLLRTALAKSLRIALHDIDSVHIKRKSIDARKKSQVKFLYTVQFSCKTPEIETRLLNDPSLKHLTPASLIQPKFASPSSRVPTSRPVVIGAGCAGLFAALNLAHAGCEPLLIERGEGAYERLASIDHFNANGSLNQESNIQFGVGGAGTFSDGKLTTGTKSPLHRLILESFVAAGAPESILWDAKAHIGSDILVPVVTHLSQEITRLGGEVLTSCKLTDIHIKQGKICGIDYQTAEGTIQHVATTALILATGHSARDVFSLLQEKDVALERKTFAMGVRIEHLQADINRAQYGAGFATSPSLGAAPYKLVSHLPNGRSAFSFCMCPGGYVVAASSEEGGVVTNGMSYAARAGSNANSGLLANVFPEDLPGDDPLAGIALQRACEQKAFELGGGMYKAPAQLVGDFIARRGATSEPGRIKPTYPRGVTWTAIDPCLPDYLADTLRAGIQDMDKRLPGFAASDAVLTAIESRSSSPVRIVRDQDCMSISTPGLFPAGEGAGYAGGIMSAATDGIRVSQAVLAYFGLGD